MRLVDERISVAVPGATGTVGQRLVSLLAEHPWFEIADNIIPHISGEQDQVEHETRSTEWRWPLDGCSRVQCWSSSWSHLFTTRCVGPLSVVTGSKERGLE